MVADIAKIADGLAIYVSSVAMFQLYGISVLQMYDGWTEVQAASALGTILGLVILNATGVYKLERQTAVLTQIKKACTGWTATVCTLLVLAFVAKVSEQFSRGWLVLWWVSGGGALVSVRIFAACGWMEGLRSTALRRSIAVVGANDRAEALIQRLAATGHQPRTEIVGLFDDRKTRIRSDICGVKHSGDLDDLAAYAQRHDLDRVIVTLPLTADQRISRVVQRLRHLPLAIDVLGSVDPMFVRGRLIQSDAAQYLNVVREPLPEWGAIMKIIEDKTIAFLALLLTAPLLVLIALVIKLDSPGPILFRQRRYGFNNKSIVVYKFRTMHTKLGDPSGQKRTVRDDPRVTRIGRFLRRSSLDELPQFINVLQGRLSVVGPRPHPPEMRAPDKLFHEAIDDYAARHRVKPGITGWAQVNGLRGEIDTIAKAEARVSFDLYYIDNWSITFDIWIILLTIVKGFRDTNAY